MGRRGILARWVADASGLAWLRPLIERRKVLQTNQNGYPNEYHGLAGDILHLIRNAATMYSPGLGMWVLGIDEGEEYAIPLSGMVADAVTYDDRIAGCADDRWLTVEAWDQS